jgi:hypothetical protein
MSKGCCYIKVDHKTDSVRIWIFCIRKPILFRKCQNISFVLLLIILSEPVFVNLLKSPGDSQPGRIDSCVGILSNLWGLGTE